MTEKSMFAGLWVVKKAAPEKTACSCQHHRSFTSLPVVARDVVSLVILSTLVSGLTRLTLTA
jgi:hypothetical protein